MKKSILSVAAAVIAGVAGIFIFTACEGDFELCTRATDSSVISTCVQTCERSKENVKKAGRNDIIEWCEAHGANMN